MPTRLAVTVCLIFLGAVVATAADGPYERERELEYRDRETERSREREREHRFITGKVVSVLDGDTCIVQDRQGVRHRYCLYGVDAPEKGQECWDRAKDCLARKIYEKEVRIDPVQKDAEGRECCRLYLGNRHINLEQVREGYGWHHTDRERVKEFAEAERDAREHRRGLWVDRHPVEPWKYRHDHVNELRDREREPGRGGAHERAVERDRPIERDREARRDREREDLDRD